jgi:hypothetical protein
VLFVKLRPAQLAGKPDRFVGIAIHSALLQAPPRSGEAGHPSRHLAPVSARGRGCRGWELGLRMNTDRQTSPRQVVGMG